MHENQLLSRENCAEESTWKREDVYRSWEAWQEDFDLAKEALPALSTYPGTLNSGSAMVLEWLQAYQEQLRRISKLFLFTRMSLMVDTNNTESKRYYGQALSLYTKFETKTAFAEPELMAIGDELLAWVDQEPALEVYRHYFNNLLRQKAHRRSPEVESILSMLEEPFGGPARTSRELTNNDLKFPDAIDSQGNHHPVHQATITPSGIDSTDRDRRRTAWQNFCDSHLAMQNTLASNYITEVQQNVFLARVRGYDSVLEMHLSSSNLPVAVFHNVIETFRKNLSVWHRYWDVKRRLLGYETIHPYDVWAPIVRDPVTIPYRRAVDWLYEALLPLGTAYPNILRRGCLDERWVDYAPNVGKMQGAASSLSIDMPPFIFMSYDDTVFSMSVLAHELGHSMHSYYIAQNQPLIYNSYTAVSSAVAETASNFNQAMLRAYLQEEMGEDEPLQINLIDEILFNFHRYFFTMPTLARFEYEVYQRAENDETLTAPVLNQIMSELYAEAYGPTMSDDPERTAITWAQFLHLFMPFYTFQYAVGISAANSLAEGVWSSQPGAAERYLSFLSAGGSLYPLDSFQLAGIDMTGPGPIEQAFGVLTKAIDRLEAMVA